MISLQMCVPRVWDRRIVRLSSLSFSQVRIFPHQCPVSPRITESCRLSYFWLQIYSNSGTDLLWNKPAVSNLFWLWVYSALISYSRNFSIHFWQQYSSLAYRESNICNMTWSCWKIAWQCVAMHKNGCLWHFETYFQDRASKAGVQNLQHANTDIEICAQKNSHAHTYEGTKTLARAHANMRRYV